MCTRSAPRRRRTRWLSAAVLVLAAGLSAACFRETSIDIGKPEKVADGVLLYRLSDPNLLSPPGPVAVQMLRLDPARIDLRSTLAQDRVMQLETVSDMAARVGAIAAINAGFFVVKNGDPAGVLEVGDELVSDAGLTRGAVGIIRQAGRPLKLVFDRIGASVSLRFRAGGEEFTYDVDGIDTTRVRGKLMLYTPRFGPDSDMAGTGVEWQLAGAPLKVVERRPNAGRTPIPRNGIVLSFGGTVLPTALERLDRGQRVTIEPRVQSLLGTLPEQWLDAQDIVGGAGLLMYHGRVLTDWTDEQLRAGFNTERHPRTMIGTSKSGAIWLVTVDGRNPETSLGMSFAELQALALKLNLFNALNLDGGGSTTMVVNGKIVNHPSDATGPRRVSDGLVVIKRK
ncbi:MAG: phosphodiester glycosidase family protein [Acidobacteria bacterium]|nr:phosphodiester glycosidase family protein [Acidobacteriota bacterium]